MKAMGRSSLASFLTMMVNVGWFVALIVLVVGVGILLVSPFVNPPEIEIQFGAPVAFTLDPNTHEVRADNAERVELRNTQGWVYYSPRSTRLVAAGALGMIAAAALALWILGNLKGVFRTLRDGRPFVRANATRIRRVGWGLILIEIARSLIAYSASSEAMTQVVAEGLRFHPRVEFDVFAIITALIVFVIAEVFREGTRLDEEQSLTV